MSRDLLDAAAPATAWAWRVIMASPAERRALIGSTSTATGPPWTGRLVLLALAWEADLALHSPDGYDGSTVEAVARAAGITDATARRTLSSMAATGYAMGPSQPGGLYRIPEVAFGGGS